MFHKNSCICVLINRRTIQRGKEAQKRAREAEAEGKDGQPSAKRGKKGDSSEPAPLTHNEKKAQRAHRYKENLRRRHRAGAVKARAASESAAGKRSGKR